MKQIIIAVDIDGTIWGNHLGTRVEGNSLNLPIAHLMEILHKYFKNTRIIVWSGGGKEYAESIVNKFGLNKYVDGVYGKHEYDETIDGEVDIAIDDQHEFALADKNLIVRMK